MDFEELRVACAAHKRFGSESLKQFALIKDSPQDQIEFLESMSSHSLNTMLMALLAELELLDSEKLEQSIEQRMQTKYGAV